jgi:hypothetical protein
LSAVVLTLPVPTSLCVWSVAITFFGCSRELKLPLSLSGAEYEDIDIFSI